MDKTGERFYEAELYRLKGELTLEQLKFKIQSSKVADSLILVTRLEAEVEECFLESD